MIVSSLITWHILKILQKENRIRKNTVKVYIFLCLFLNISVVNLCIWKSIKHQDNSVFAYDLYHKVFLNRLTQIAGLFNIFLPFMHAWNFVCFIGKSMNYNCFYTLKNQSYFILNYVLYLNSIFFLLECHTRASVVQNCNPIDGR